MAVYPHYRTMPELIREFGRPAPIRQAVSNLFSYGLIVLHGNTPQPAYHCPDWMPGERRQALWRESGTYREAAGLS